MPPLPHLAALSPPCRQQRTLPPLAHLAAISPPCRHYRTLPPLAQPCRQQRTLPPLAHLAASSAPCRQQRTLPPLAQSCRQQRTLPPATHGNTCATRAHLADRRPTAAVRVVVRRDLRVLATSVRPPLPFAVSWPTQTVLAPGWLSGRLFVGVSLSIARTGTRLPLIQLSPVERDWVNI